LTDWRDAAIRPDWPAPHGVHALFTTRVGGESDGPYAGLNLGDHVGDAPAVVAANRELIRASLPAMPVWLEQVHGIDVVDAAAAVVDVPKADGAIATQPGVVCAVMTADCLPVLFARDDGSAVGAAHAGWRGLCNGVLETTIARLGEPGRLLAWLGPAIGPTAFEVGDEVRAAFVAHSIEAAAAFKPGVREGKWWADIYLLAYQRLAAAGVTHVFGGDLCTVSDATRFYSYRRDKVTGRMAALIWRD